MEVIVGPFSAAAGEAGVPAAFAVPTGAAFIAAAINNARDKLTRERIFIGYISDFSEQVLLFGVCQKFSTGYLKRAVLIRRDASDTHYALAVCYRSIDSQSKYREELQNTLLFDPKMPEANYDYGKLLLGDGDKAGAAEHFRVSLDAAPGNELPQDALDGLGTFDEHLSAALSLKAGKPKAALTEARIAGAIDSRSVPALDLVGELYAKLGNKTKAAIAFRRALLLDPNDSAAKTGLKRVTDGK